MSANLVSVSMIRRSSYSAPWTSISDGLVVGKDILELLSSSMYVDPMCIYREYIQNCADAIDDARESGIVAASSPGRVDIQVDPSQRTIKIRDNGTGIRGSDFVRRLVAFGASHKRGCQARGFRGVGRLAGLAYCQELVFRSRAKGEPVVHELRWNCRELKTLLRAVGQEPHLKEVVQETVNARVIDAGKWPDHFFEVELNGVIRHRNDQLLDSGAVATYLAQVAPIPFAADFKYAERITTALSPPVALGELEIQIAGLDNPVCRPHRNAFSIGTGTTDSFQEILLISVPGLDGGIAAVGWVLHHSYAGALPAAAGIKGLRVRCGNIQVGDDRLFEELFLEPRFNSWTVGEVHVIDPRILPNGRRDHFEQNAHFQNLLAHLTPLARDLSRRCRTSSIKRNRSREFMRLIEITRDNLAIIRQGSLGKTERGRILREVQAGIADLEKRLSTGLIECDGEGHAQRDIASLKRELTKLSAAASSGSSLSRLPRHQRRAYEHVFSLIYECAQNKSAAKVLVDRILARLPVGQKGK